MKRRRMIKLLMSFGFDRNDAVRAADLCDGNTSHDEMLCALCEAFARVRYEMLRQYIIEGDSTDKPIGMSRVIHG